MRPALSLFCAGIMACGSAYGRDLTPADLHRIEAINQRWNAAEFDAARRGADGLCAYFATSKALDLIQAGYGDDTRLAIVTTEHGTPHEVAEVTGARDGKPTTIVLDIRTSWTASRKDLEALGYRWVREFGAANHPTEDSTR